MRVLLPSLSRWREDDALASVATCGAFRYSVGLMEGLSGDAEPLMLLRISALGEFAMFCSNGARFDAGCPAIAWSTVPFRFFCGVNQRPLLLLFPFSWGDVWSAEYMEPVEQESCKDRWLGVRGLLKISIEVRLRLLPVLVWESKSGGLLEACVATAMTQRCAVLKKILGPARP